MKRTFKSLKSEDINEARHKILLSEDISADVDIILRFLEFHKKNSLTVIDNYWKDSSEELKEALLEFLIVYLSIETSDYRFVNLLSKSWIFNESNNHLQNREIELQTVFIKRMIQIQDDLEDRCQ